MATGNYRLKTDKDWNSIYFRFKQGKQFDIELSTGIETPKGRWSASKQEILSTAEMDYKAANVKLKEFSTYILREFQDSKLDAQMINSKWMKEKISTFFNRETYNPEIDNKIFFAHYITKFIEESRTKKNRKGNPIKPRTIQHYTTTLTKLQEYEEYEGKRLKLTDIDQKFHGKFMTFLEEQQHLNPNTIGGYMDNIKLFCRNADQKDYNVSKDYKLPEFYSPTNDTNDVYLTEQEIDTIYSHKFEHDYLSNARDWLIIGVWTGLRVSDLLKLRPEDIKDGLIHNTNQKTDYPAIIPVHHQVEEILSRLGGFPRKISEQKFNKYIKEVCKQAGITERVEGARISPIEVVGENGKKTKIHRKKKGIYPKHELISSHTCRRSFATNHYGKLDTLTIMKISGHVTESQFLAYIKITPKEHAEKLRALWLSQRKVV